MEDFYKMLENQKVFISMSVFVRFQIQIKQEPLNKKEISTSWSCLLERFGWFCLRKDET
jgi:hypothetical protein